MLMNSRWFGVCVVLRLGSQMMFVGLRRDFTTWSREIVVKSALISLEISLDFTWQSRNEQRKLMVLGPCESLYSNVSSLCGWS